jgi:predicted DNA-binding protein with PD1-like motif
LSLFSNQATSFITVKQLTTEEVATLSALSTENNIECSKVSTTGEEVFTVEIWHEKKGKVKTVKSNKKLETIDLSGLDKGNYILHIIIPTAIYKEHILIE